MMSFSLFQCLGNHEFDNGIEGLMPFIEKLDCPTLAANLILTAVPELAKEPNLKNSMVKDINGVKIGIIGYLTPDTKVEAKNNDVEYIEEVVALRKEVKKLQDAGIKILIALGHSGYFKDLEIAQKVEGLDLVIGGHTNTFLWNGTSPDIEKPQGPYPTYVAQASGRIVPVVQAHAFTKYLGKLHIVFNDQGEIVHLDGKPILLDKTVKQDRDVLKIIEQYEGKVKKFSEKVIGSTPLIFEQRECRVRECILGNLITDSMVQYYATQYKGKYWTDAPVSMIQRGGIRSSISHDVITKGDLLSVLPFDANLLTIKMNGTILLKALEHSVANYNLYDSPGAFLHFSGIKVAYNIKSPSGSRVVRAEIRCTECKIPHYSKIEDSQVYKIIMSEFIANGGDGFAMFKDLPTTALDYSELTATEYYVKHNSPVIVELDGRITMINDSVYTESCATILPPSLCLALLLSNIVSNVQ